MERGDLGRLPLRSIRKVCAALEVRLHLAPSWRGAQLPRLMDARHAALVEQVVASLTSFGWEAAVEYSFNHYGERGVVDVLAWRAADRALLVVEVKSEMDDVQAMLGILDRKIRLVPSLVAAERDWKAAALGVLLVMPECSTGRTQVRRHRATFDAVLPARNLEVRQWLASSPAAGPLRGILFQQPGDGVTAMAGVSGRGGAMRVRMGRNRAAPVAEGRQARR